MNVRRVVTGLNADGKGSVIEDGSPPRVYESTVPGGLSNTLAWATDPGEAIPSTGADPTAAVASYVPPAGGTRLIIAEFAPLSEAVGIEIDPDDAAADAVALPGLGDKIEEGGIHATETVDYSIVLSGELWLELDDGSETHLHAGDIVVQNGVRHAWHNKSNERTVLAAVLIGAPRG